MERTSQRALNAMWTAALFFALLAAGGFAGLDMVVAQFTAAQPDGGTIWARGTDLFDAITLMDTSTFLLGAILVLAAGLLLILRSTRSTGFLVLYIGVAQFFSAAFAHLAKPQFGRVRPFEAVGGGDVWFAGGNSFPSLHAAFYAGLFFPLIVLFPRLAPIWLAPPLFVAAARVMEHEQYLSDVSVSLALAALLAAGLAFFAEKGGA